MFDGTTDSGMVEQLEMFVLYFDPDPEPFIRKQLHNLFHGQSKHAISFTAKSKECIRRRSSVWMA